MLSKHRVTISLFLAITLLTVIGGVYYRDYRRQQAAASSALKIKEEAEAFSRPILSLDRGQGFAALIDDLSSLLTEAQARFDSRRFSDATSLYLQVLNHGRVLQQNEEARQSARGQRSEAQANRQQAAVAKLAQECAQLWNKAEALFTQADERFERSDFAKSTDLWRQANQNYLEMTKRMNSVVGASKSFENELKAYGKKWLELFGGPRWKEVSRLASEAEEKLSSG